MASKTRVTRRIRRRKKAVRGKARKKALATKGSTRSKKELFGE